jgi:hypothetical protein
MGELKATHHKPTGFSDRPTYDEPVTIVGYCYGRHQDAGGYDRQGECTLAVFIDSGGRLKASPLHYFSTAKEAGSG